MDLKILIETPPWEWPEGTGKIFHETLTNDHADASDRALAIELAGNLTVINDELVEALLSILQNDNESEELRGKAAISLGPVLDHADMNGFDDPDDVPISEYRFHKILASLHKLYLDVDVPENVRRLILEASVRAPKDWHQDAIRAAYLSDDEEWKQTAVFSMRWVRGFDNQIREALESNNRNIHYQAVRAAGNWEVDAAWSHISGLVNAQVSDKQLLLASIDAVAHIRPMEAVQILMDLTDSDDDDIVDAVHEALAMVDGLSNDEFNDDDDDDDDDDE